jgi:hypothetical protein
MSDFALRRSDLDMDISPFSKAKVAECFAKSPHGFGATDEKHADTPNPLALLRTRREWPRCRAADSVMNSRLLIRSRRRRGLAQVGRS